MTTAKVSKKAARNKKNRVKTKKNKEFIKINRKNLCRYKEKTYLCNANKKQTTGRFPGHIKHFTLW